MEYEEPYSTQDRILSRLNDINRTLDRIEKQLNDARYQTTVVDGPTLNSIARAVWIVAWIAMGGAIFLVLAILSK
jgi:hypothetical protein